MSEIRRRAFTLIIADREQDILQAASIHISQNSDFIHTEGNILCFRAPTKSEQTVGDQDVYVDKSYRKRIGKPTIKLLNKLGIPDF